MSTRIEDYDGAPEVEGVIVFDQGWYLLEMPRDFHATLLQTLAASGEVFKPAGRPHISVMKDEAPSRNKEDWGTAFVGERVTVRCHLTIRKENGCHFWIDCHSPRLCQMREHFALVTLKRGDGVYLVNFHMTIARRTTPIEPQRRAELRLTPHSHIDVETGMQHM